MNKQILRRTIRLAKEKAYEDPLFRKLSSEKIASLACMCLSTRAEVRIGLFLSMYDEPDTAPLLTLLSQEGKFQLFVPRVEGDEMQFYPYDKDKLIQVPPFGIWEPDGTDDPVVPEIIIVPGVAFDRYGGRVGRGKGFYDRYIASHRKSIKRLIAICYDLQLLSGRETVPTDPHDQPMDEVITDREQVVISS